MMISHNFFVILAMNFFVIVQHKCNIRAIMTLIDVFEDKYDRCELRESFWLYVDDTWFFSFFLFFLFIFSITSVIDLFSFLSLILVYTVQINVCDIWNIANMINVKCKNISWIFLSYLFHCKCSVNDNN